MSDQVYQERPVKVTFTIPSNCQVRYTIGGGEPDESSTLAVASTPIEVSEGQKLKFKSFRDGYLPNITYQFSNGFPELEFERIADFTQLVHSSNTNFINDYWSDSKISPTYFITKVKETYFLYYLPVGTYNQIDKDGVGSNSSYSDLNGLFFTSLVYYSKTMTDWQPIPGFENNFSSPIGLMGLPNSKLILDIFYWDNKYNIVYTEINPQRWWDWVSKDYRRFPAISRQGKSLTTDDTDFNTKELINSSESVNLYILKVDEIGSEGETEIVGENLQNNALFSTKYPSFGSIPGFFDSRFLEDVSVQHIITENAAYLCFEWFSTKTTSSSTLKFHNNPFFIILRKGAGGTYWEVIDCYTTSNSSSGSSIPYSDNHRASMGKGDKGTYSHGLFTFSGLVSYNSEGILNSRNLLFEDVTGYNSSISSMNFPRRYKDEFFYYSNSNYFGLNARIPVSPYETNTGFTEIYSHEFIGPAEIDGFYAGGEILGNNDYIKLMQKYSSSSANETYSLYSLPEGLHLSKKNSSNIYTFISRADIIPDEKNYFVLTLRDDSDKVFLYKISIKSDIGTLSNSQPKTVLKKTISRTPKSIQINIGDADVRTSSDMEQSTALDSVASDNS